MKLSRIPAEILIALLRGYKRVLSPLFLPSCRYTPTCSEYALEAVDRQGAVRGSVLSIWRLLRCHPFAHGGYDPVPMDKTSDSCGVPLRRTHSTPSLRSVAQGRLAEGRCPHPS